MRLFLSEYRFGLQTSTLANSCFCSLWESSPWPDPMGLEFTLTGHAHPVSSDWARGGILVRLTPFCLRLKCFQLLQRKARDCVASDKRIQIIRIWDFEVCLTRHFKKCAYYFVVFSELPKSSLVWAVFSLNCLLIKPSCIITYQTIYSQGRLASHMKEFNNDTWMEYCYSWRKGSCSVPASVVGGCSLG